MIHHCRTLAAADPDWQAAQREYLEPDAQGASARLLARSQAAHAMHAIELRFCEACR